MCDMSSNSLKLLTFFFVNKTFEHYLLLLNLCCKKEQLLVDKNVELQSEGMHVLSGFLK